MNQHITPHAQTGARTRPWLRKVLGMMAGLGITLMAHSSAQAQASRLDGINYIPADIDNSVLVVDTKTNSILQKIPNVGQHPIQLKALPDRSKIYVDNFGLLKMEISVIDTNSNRIIKRIPTFGAPYATTTLTHDGRYLFFSTSLSVVQVIDTQTDTIVKTFPMSLLPQGVEISPDDKTFYVFYPSGVRAYSTATGKPVKPFLYVGLLPAWSNMSHDGSKLYGLNFIGGDVAVIDTQAWKVTKRLNMGLLSYPISGTVTPNGKQLWVCNINAYNMTVIDIEHDRIEKVIPVSRLPVYIGFSPDGQRGFLSDLGPLTQNLNFIGRALVFDIFYALPPNLPGNVTTFDTNTGLQVGQPLVTPTGPLVGVYF
jgi:YVTN family beta-propeller protein